MTSRLQDCGIIVLGLPRSGTTLLRRILDAHPRIACGGETFLLRSTARFIASDTITDGIDYGVLGGLTAAGFSESEICARVRNLAFDCFEEIAARQGKPRWASKTAVDSFYVREIERLYAPHARFLCVTRHALDAALSLQDLTDANEVYIRELHDYIARFPRPLEAYAHAWQDVTSMLLDFAQRNNDAAMLIRYEDLVAKPLQLCEEVFGFLGEDWDPAILDRAFEADTIQGLGDWKTYSRNRIDEASVGRWKTLRSDVVSRLGLIVNSLLTTCGYDEVPVAPLPDHVEAMHRYELSMRFNLARAKTDDNGG